MLENDNFNTLINHVVFTIDLSTKDKNYHQELKNYLYLITAGMIVTYGDEYIDDIYNTILNINFYNDKNVVDCYYGDKKDSNICYINPTNHNYSRIFYDFLYGFPAIKVNYELIYKNIDFSWIKTLEYLTFELNSILFKKNKKYSIIENIKIRFDSLKSGMIEEIVNNNIFVKVFNVLQAEEIVKNILLFRNINIKNNNFNNMILNFKDIDYKTYKFEGLEPLVNLFRPLYEVKNIKLLINNYIFLNNNDLEKEFDNVLGRNSYNNVCKKLNNLNNKLCNLVKGNNFISYYDISLDYVSIKNDFVNKYINIKCLNERA